MGLNLNYKTGEITFLIEMLKENLLQPAENAMEHCQNEKKNPINFSL